MKMMRTSAARARLPLLAILALGLGAGACQRTQTPAADTETGTSTAAATSGPAPQVELGASVQLDSGNTAYRAKDYPAALAHYRNAAARQPALAAAWMGIAMAQNALGNKAGADSAIRKVEELAPGTMSAHPTTGGAAAGPTGSPLPPGHPTLPAPPKR